MRKPIQDRWPLSFALLGVVALLSLGARGCPPATPEIPVGTDCWETNPDATVWTHKGAFPAGFFGGDPKSNAIPHPPELHFAGNPLTPDEVKACGCPEKVDTKVKWLNRHGDETTDIRHAVTQVVELTTKVDTCVRREQRAEFPGKGASAKVDIELLQLSLKSASPITVEYKDVAAFSILVLVLIFRPTGLLGKPDIEKIRPIVYSPEAQKYHGIGKFIGKAFEIGKKL